MHIEITTFMNKWIDRYCDFIKVEGIGEHQCSEVVEGSGIGGIIRKIR